MRIVYVALLLILVLGFQGCKRASRDQQAAALLREANNLLEQGSKSVEEWTSEYGKTFTPQNRAKFPSNRDWMRTHADNIVKSLDENTRISNDAIRKYDEAVVLITDERQRRGFTLLTSALKKGIEVNELHKSQMQLVYDEKIVDEKTFNEKFLEIIKTTQALDKEIQAQFTEGRQLLGM